MIAFFAFDLVLTALHVRAEYRGELWQYFGDIAGVRIPRRVGVALFSIALPVVLFALSAAAFVPMLLGHAPTAWALGALAGARAGDGAFSHLVQAMRGFRPNPGIVSGVVGMVEAVALLMIAGEAPVGVGYLAGAAFFAAVIPSLDLLRYVLPKRYRVERWRP
jgi:hypothetical protein